MSGTLNDVLMFTSRNRPATLEMSDDKDGVGDKDSIEWQILRDGNSRRPKPSDLEFRLPFGSSPKQQQLQQRVMTPAAAAHWESARNSLEPCRGAVNYLRSFGPAGSNSSNYSVDGGQVGGIRRTLDGQLLNRDEVTDTKDDFRAESPGLSSLILGQGGHTDSAQVFGCGLVQSSSVAVATKGQQQVHKAPHFRDLFPAQSSSFSSVLAQENLSNEVNEHVHLQKKPRRYDFGDGSGPLSQAEIESIHLNEASPFRSSYPPPTCAPLANFIDTNNSYRISPSTSFSSSLLDRPTFHSNIPLQNLSLSSYQASSPTVPLKSNSNDNSSARSPLVDYSFSSVDTKLHNGLRCVNLSRGSDFLLSAAAGGFRPLNLMDGPSQTTISRDYTQPGSLGQVCSPRATAMDAASRAAWPAGFINFPSNNSERPGGGIGGISRRSLLDLDHQQHHHQHHQHLSSKEREVQRIHPILESQMRLVIQKQLTTTDVGSLGRIILPKKEAETHLPHLPDKEGIEMCLYDYDVDRTWIMKYRFWPNNKSRMYLLENTGEFAKFHGVQQGDLLLICKQLPARYVLRVKKMARPLRPLMTPPQSVSESGGAEDAGSGGGADTVSSSRALTSSASSRTLNSTAASKEVCGTDATPSAFSCMEAASSHRAQLHVVNGQCHSQNLSLGSLNKHQQGKASSISTDDRNYSYMAVHGGSGNTGAAPEHDPTELDGESVYNLEEFPSLIEAEEIIDIFPLDSDSSEAQLSPVESFEVVRKTHHMRADLT